MSSANPSLRRALPAALAASARTRFADSAAAYLLWPWLALAVAVVWLVPLRGDLWVADHLYAWEGHAWALRHRFATESLIHVAGKRLSTLAWLVAAALFAATWWKPRLRAWRWPLLYLLAAVALGTGLVSSLKHVTDMDCPWDIDRYGGLRPYVDLFTRRPIGLPRGECFPAGHASAGYAWVALYFFFLAVRPAWRWRGLAVGLLIGAAFGLSQQLRGAHFLSHDLFALTLCWSVAALGYALLRSRLGGMADMEAGKVAASEGRRASVVVGDGERDG